MKYTDADMRMMAIGEVGADVMTVFLTVVAFICLNDLPFLIQLPICYFVCRVVSWLALGFVHIGYNPDEQSTQ